MRANWSAILAVGYLVGMVVTYGYSHRYELRQLNEDYPNMPRINEEKAEVRAIICAFVWPLYVPMHASRLMWVK